MTPVHRARAHPVRPLMSAVLAVWLVLALGGCAMVKVTSVGPRDYIAMKRGDVLSTGKLSDASQETLRVVGIEPGQCQKDMPACVGTLGGVGGLSEERRMATLAEIWTQVAMARTAKAPAAADDAALVAWLEAARHAYAYLFFTERRPSQRTFENHQTRVSDYYNYAVQQALGNLFVRQQAQAGGAINPGAISTVAGWEVSMADTGLRLPGGAAHVDNVTPASMLRFEGLRSTYRRDGFGAELVAEVAPAAVGDPVAILAAAATETTAATASGPADADATVRVNDESGGEPVDGAGDRRRRRPSTPAFSEMPFAPVSVLVRFDGADLAQVLATRRIVIEPYDPYRVEEVAIHGEPVPLAANFTAGYGLWLARSGFADQALRSMLGRERGIDRPHLYLMQPYDPNRRIVLMLHGLASSPEAWVNVANELTGDRRLREHYQIWQVYYPTNLPIAWNQARIRELVSGTLTHFDPGGQAPASQHMVLVGHSMGGVLARLLVSSSGTHLEDTLLDSRRLDSERGRRLRRRLQPLLHFEPLPNVDRAIFIAAPHRGTPVAGSRLGRLVGRVVRLPVTLLEQFGDVLQDLAEGMGTDEGESQRIMPNSIDNLRDTDPFVRAAAELPIAGHVKYHTIVGQDDLTLPLPDSSDGVVPYRSAHLEGAASEKVIESWHSVQETPQAILEIRRILHEQIDAPGAQAR